jgi:hypothetical protein
MSRYWYKWVVCGNTGCLLGLRTWMAGSAPGLIYTTTIQNALICFYNSFLPPFSCSLLVSSSFFVSLLSMAFRLEACHRCNLSLYSSCLLRTVTDAMDNKQGRQYSPVALKRGYPIFGLCVFMLSPLIGIISSQFLISSFHSLV